MPERLSEKDSTALYFVKVIAILTSVAAHVSVIDLSTPVIGFFTRMWDMASCVSVGSFLIIGGILYTRTPGDSRSFWKRKAVSMILPWLVCGTLTYGYRALYEESSFLGLAYWLIGKGTWLYYVTIHLLMLLVFKPIRNNPPALWACVAVTVVQLLLKTRGGGVPSPFGSDYLNPLHWVGFFALGILLRRQGLRLSKGFLGGCTAVLAVTSVIVYRKWIYDYFHILNMAFSVSAFFMLFAAGRCLADSKLRRWIREIGTSTYCIYLLHTLIIPPILRRIPGDTFKAIFAPVIGMAIMMLLIEIGKFLTARLPFGDRLRAMVGLR